MLKYNSNNKKLARELRKNMTDAERKLWKYLRRNQIHNLKFYRQKPIGNYIVDFYCPKIKIVIEADGDQHYYEKGKQEDKLREEFLTKNGIKVLRFGNNEIFNNTEGVVEKIWLEVEKRL
ncbi:MAG: endonuclease domain-containing protein [Candidatus Moraniibacteriota bacterium]